MSRSGYSEDYDEIFPNASAMYAANIDRAASGKRGQKFFKDLLAALDEMPVKRLIAEDLVRDGEMCAIGALGVARGIDMTGVDPENARAVSKTFGYAECLARDVAFANDEQEDFSYSDDETPEARWVRMREWVKLHIKPGSPS